MPSRRNVLKIIGGGTILAATGATGFAMTRTPSKALAPWSQTGNHTEPRKRALAHALLAPNPHNRQPWLVELKGEDTVVLHRDETRDLPATDPFNRQIFIGLGCFIEQMVVAAGADGQKVDVDLFPEGEQGPVAVARFSAGANADPLAAHILQRRSCKEAFSETPVASDAARHLSGIADIVTDAGRVQEIRDLTWAAFQVETYTPYTLKESVDLMRVGKSEINANPDGIDMQGAMFDALRRVGFLTHDVLMDTENSSFQGYLAEYKDMLYATPAYAVITTVENNRHSQIAAGRRWLRLNLTTTSLGMSLHPVSQALQEYPEMTEHYATAQRILAKPGETVQMLGRLGYGPQVAETPRWPLESRLLNERE